MSDENTTAEEPPKKKSKLGFIIGIFACVFGLVGGFFVAYSGMLFPMETAEAQTLDANVLEDVGDIAFIPVDPIIVSLRPGSSNKHLSFRSQLEVPAIYRDDVEHLLPRIVDIMNGYLSALDTADFESPAIIVRLRSQLLRRVQVVTGLERVNDLLIMEFVLN